MLELGTGGRRNDGQGGKTGLSTGVSWPVCDVGRVEGQSTLLEASPDGFEEVRCLHRVCSLMVIRQEILGVTGIMIRTDDRRLGQLTRKSSLLPRIAASRSCARGEAAPLRGCDCSRGR